MWGRFLFYGVGFLVCAVGCYLSWEAYDSGGMLMFGVPALVFGVLVTRG